MSKNSVRQEDVDKIHVIVQGITTVVVCIASFAVYEGYDTDPVR